MGLQAVLWNYNSQDNLILSERADNYNRVGSLETDCISIVNRSKAKERCRKSPFNNGAGQLIRCKQINLDTNLPWTQKLTQNEPETSSKVQNIKLLEDNIGINLDILRYSMTG